MKFDIRPFYPCWEEMEYYESKASFEDAWNDCERGDWMLRIAAMSGVDNRTLARAKALCANTVRHLMNEVSTDAIDAALRYADGAIDEKELEKANAAVSDALAKANKATAAGAAAVATISATYVPTDATVAAPFAAAPFAAAAKAKAANAAANVAAKAAAKAAYAAYLAVSMSPSDYITICLTRLATATAEIATNAAAADAARRGNWKETANICREVLTDAVFERVQERQKKAKASLRWSWYLFKRFRIKQSHRCGIYSDSDSE